MARPGMEVSPSRKVGRAEYKPLVSYVVRRPATRPDRQRCLDVIDEAEALQGDKPVGKQRNWYIAPEDKRVRQTLEQLQKYVDRTEIETRFMSLVKLLLSRPKLPYNPYPGFQKRLRTLAERFHMFKDSRDTILETLDNPTQAARMSGLVKPEKKDGIWGLVGLLHVLDPDMVLRYHWLVETLTPVKGSLVVDVDNVYSNQAMPALLGSCVFHGTLYPQPQDVTVRIEYLIAGPDQAEGLRMFAESIVRDLKHMERGQHEVTGVQLPTADTDTTKTWTVDGILENRDGFSRDVIAEVKCKHPIRVQCVMRLEEHSATYMLGEKQYVLTFVKVNANTGVEEGLVTFCDLPVATLHEGVFLNMLHADSYMSAFSQVVGASSMAGGTTTDGNPNGRRKSKSQIQSDGFRYGTKIRMDPYSQQIIQPIRAELQQRVSREHPVLDVFSIVHSLLLLACMDRASHGDDLMVEIYRVLHSTAARLHHLQQLNATLRALVKKFMGVGDSEVVTQVFVQYTQGLSDIFSSKLQERSVDLAEAGRVMLGRLADLTTTREGLTRSVPLTEQTHKELLHLHGYKTTLFLHLVEDALNHCPKIKGAIASHQKLFPDLVQRPHTPVRRNGDTAKKEKLLASEGLDTFIHGLEEETILKHDKQVINVATCKERDSAPKTMATESVLLTYLVDTRLDEVWPGLLMDLLSDSVLPPNPYPRLVSALRTAAARMDCCHEMPQKLTKRLLHGAARLEDQDTFVYHLPGADAYGTKSALALVDSSVFFQLMVLCEPFVQKDFIQRKGPFRIAICSGVGGHTPLYGRMSPYLHEVHLEEHCYIRGPSGAAHDALHMYSKIVCDHIVSLSRAAKFPICAVYMGEDEIPWKLNAILANKNTFTAELERQWKARRKVYMKVYTLMDWRYLAVNKYFLFHYVNVEETVFEEFFPRDISSIYQLVFFEGGKASFHYQYGGPGNHSDPLSASNTRQATKVMEEKVAHARHQRDWLSVHRWLLTRNLITAGSSHVPEVWRILHSIAGQAEYLVTLARSLHDLVSYIADQHAHVAPSTVGDGRRTKETNPMSRQRQKAGNTRQSRQEQQNNKHLVGALDLKALGRMMLAFRLKLHQVCSMQSAMVASCLGEVIKVKVQQVTERDPTTRELFVIPGEGTLVVLEEVVGMLETLRDTTAYDLHRISPEAQAILRTIEELGHPMNEQTIHLVTTQQASSG